METGDGDWSTDRAIAQDAEMLSAQLQAMRIEARQRQLDAALAAQTALIEIQRLTGQPLVATASEGNTP